MSNPFLNIGDLGAAAEEPTDYWDGYDVPTAGGANVIPAGRYTFTVPQPGDDFKPGQTKAGFFTYELNPTIASGDHKGKKLNYVRLSVKKYSNRQGSQAGDLIVATGVKATPRTRDEWARTALQLAGKKFDGIVKLEAYDKEQKKNLTLVTRADGQTKLRYVVTSDNVVVRHEDSEKEKQMEDEAEANGGRVVWANAKLDRVLPVEKAAEQKKAA